MAEGFDVISKSNTKNNNKRGSPARFCYDVTTCVPELVSSGFR